MAPEQGKAEGSSFSAFLMPALAAIGTGIGVLGFVMFFGGFILWARFKGAGLPANEAVARVPRGDLVATGASFIVPGVLAALGLVAFALAVWDIFLGGPRRKRRERAEIKCEEASERLADLQEEQQRLELHKEGATKAERAKIAKRLAELTRREIPRQRQACREATEETKSERLELSERLLQILIGILPLVAALAYLLYKGWDDLSLEYAGYLVVAALLMGAIAVVVVSITDHFAWYAFSVFLGVGVMIAVANYVRTQDHPKVSPVAMLNGSSPVAGFFVAETSEAVYIGRPRPIAGKAEAGSLEFDPEGATLIRLPKDAVTDLTIGPLMDADKAYQRSLELAQELALEAEAPLRPGRTRPARPAP